MIDLYTLVRKEVWRFLRVWKQTLLPPVITIVLYLLIFWTFIGSQIEDIKWHTYIEFIFPWLLMMSVIMASYWNTSFGFYWAKFQKHIEEILISPMSHIKVLAGFCIGGITRGLVVGGLVLAVWVFMVDLEIFSFFYSALFLLLTALLFSLAWLLNGIYAKSFDDVNVIPSFVITPLVYLGWVFYSTDLLPPVWQTISQANPILYMVNWLRYGFINFTDVKIWIAISILIFFIIFLWAWCMYLLKKGYGIRS